MKFDLLKHIILLLALPAWLDTGAQGLIIPSGSYVIGNAGIIVLQNNWTNNGSFTHNGGAVVFAGATQTLGGTTATTFNNIIIQPGSTTTVSTTGQKLFGVLQSNGSFYSNGNFTLLSTASQTAAIDGSGTGEVLGNLTMQRYLPSGFGYRYFSSPFTADTVGNFASAISLTTAFPDVYKYDESQATAGWINYTAGSGTLAPLAGYAVNFGTSTAALTVSLTGVVSNHTQTVTLYNHNQTYTLGFNLVGNPYPSPIDWNSSTGWTKTNIDNALYFFSNGTTNQYTGTYSSYINGVSSNGIASNIIAAMQGFFVHVSNGTYPVTGTLAVNNNARNTQPSVTFFGDNSPAAPLALLRLHAGFSIDTTTADPLVIYLNTSAASSFDKTLDALKLMNTRPDVPSLYAISSDQRDLSIQAIPYPAGNLQIIPLGLQTSQDGQVIFQLGELREAPDFQHIYLDDTQSGVEQDLTQNTYTVSLAKGTYEKRFFLKFSPSTITGPATTSAETFIACNSAGTLNVKSLLPPGVPAVLHVYNILGQLMQQMEISDNTWHSIPLTATGVYIVSLSDGHTIHAKKIFVGGHP